MCPLPESQPLRRSAILCYVTGRLDLRAADETQSRYKLLDVIERAAAAGVDWIQLREKDLSGRELAQLTRAALRAIAGSNVQLIVNDRLDVAVSAQAGGVHLGERGLPSAAVREFLAKRISGRTELLSDFLMGVSCHSLESAIAAERAGASYIFFGPVFATPSKAEFGPPQGPGRLAEVCAAVRIPVLAIGGITTASAGECLAAGASGIAAIRMFQDSSDLAGTVARLRAGATAPSGSRADQS